MDLELLVFFSIEIIFAIFSPSFPYVACNDQASVIFFHVLYDLVSARKSSCGC